MFCLDYFLGPVVHARALALWPLGGGFLPWQVVSYAFPARRLHAPVSSTCWAFGCSAPTSSALWGQKRFLQLYFASVLTAALTQLAFARR